MAIELTDRDVLLVIDVQNDFCDGGPLAVPGGQDVVPVIHRIAPAFSHVILTQDWHPQDHDSFASNHAGRNPFESKETDHGHQVLWPIIACKAAWARHFTPTCTSTTRS